MANPSTASRSAKRAPGATSHDMRWSTIHSVQERTCNASLLLSAKGAWTTGTSSKVEWQTARCPLVDMIGTPPSAPLLFVTIGDSHMRNALLAVCQRSGSSVTWRRYTAECSAHGGRLRGQYQLLNLLDETAVKSAALHAHRAVVELGRVPDVVLLDGWQWALQLLYTQSDEPAATAMRSALVAQQWDGSPLPHAALLEDVATLWAGNASDYVQTLATAFARLATTRGERPPLLAWMTTQRSGSITSLAMGRLNFTVGCSADARCKSRTFFMTHISSNSTPRCCAPWLHPEVNAFLNARARAMALAHGLLVLDAEQLLLSVRPEDYLWDANHLRHQYTVGLQNLLFNAVTLSTSNLLHVL